MPGRGGPESGLTDYSPRGEAINRKAHRWQTYPAVLARHWSSAVVAGTAEDPAQYGRDGIAVHQGIANDVQREAGRSYWPTHAAAIPSGVWALNRQRQALTHRAAFSEADEGAGYEAVASGPHRPGRADPRGESINKGGEAG